MEKVLVISWCNSNYRVNLHFNISVERRINWEKYTRIFNELNNLNIGIYFSINFNLLIGVIRWLSQ